MARVHRAADWAALTLGLVMITLGTIIAAGGAWLIVLGGSFYYLPAGFGLVISGYLLAQRRVEGAWLYLVIFLFTLIWAWWEVGANGWALVPRTVGPALLLICVIAISPKLNVYRHNYEGTATMAAGFLLLIGAAFVMIGPTNRADAAVGVVPAPGMKMEDPSPLKTGADWPAYGGSYSARRYSPLDQINRDNVAKLTKVWTFHTGDLPNDHTKNTYGAETTPLKVGDTLFLCTPKNIIIAIDPQTGKQRWRYDPEVPDENIPYTAACRGLAYYAVPKVDAAQACATRIIEGTLDARVIAVDAKTGKPCDRFGYGGQVDTTIGIGEHDPGMFSITSAPIIVRGVIVVGHQVLDGQKRDAPSGVIQGYDADTGALRWGWDMAKPDATVPPPVGETYTRGTPNMWTTASGDEQLGLVYLPLGVSAVDYWSGSRSEREKEFATSLVALDVTTGKPVWHFQTVHNDVWDYDLGSQATAAPLSQRSFFQASAATFSYWIAAQVSRWLVSRSVPFPKAVSSRNSAQRRSPSRCFTPFARQISRSAICGVCRLSTNWPAAFSFDWQTTMAFSRHRRLSHIRSNTPATMAVPTGVASRSILRAAC